MFFKKKLHGNLFWGAPMNAVIAWNARQPNPISTAETPCTWARKVSERVGVEYDGSLHPDAWAKRVLDKLGIEAEGA